MSALEGYRIYLDQKDVPKGTLSRPKGTHYVAEFALGLNSNKVNTRSGCNRKQTSVKIFIQKTNLNHNTSTNLVIK